MSVGKADGEPEPRREIEMSFRGIASVVPTVLIHKSK